MAKSQMCQRIELWLKRGDRLRRPMSRDFLPADDFEDQRETGVAYVIYELVKGTYSDGKGGRPKWQKV